MTLAIRTPNELHEMIPFSLAPLLLEIRLDCSFSEA